MIIGTLARLVQKGMIEMTVDPELRGDSVVPTRIVFHTRHGGAPGSVQPVIEVW